MHDRLSARGLPTSAVAAAVSSVADGLLSPQTALGARYFRLGRRYAACTSATPCLGRAYLPARPLLLGLGRGLGLPRALLVVGRLVEALARSFGDCADDFPVGLIVDREE